MIFQVSYNSKQQYIYSKSLNKSSISIQTACKSCHNISAHDCALKQSTTIQLTIVQRNINYQTMILQVSYKSSSIISTANHSISSAFPFVKHANAFTIYLRVIALSINQHTVQLTIVQRNINYQTMILQVSYVSSRIISTANTQLGRHFQSNSMQILSQYICAYLGSKSINIQFN